MATVQRALLAILLLAAGNAARAHHSYAMYDRTRHVTVHGTVKAVEWTNPHVWVWIVGDGGSQGLVTYGFETASPGELVRFFDWSRASLRIGDKVIAEYVPLRSGRNGGALRRLTLSSGRVLETPMIRVTGPDHARP